LVKLKRRQTVKLFLLALLGTVIFVSLFGSYTTTLEAFQIELRVKIFDQGFTQLEFPPLGLVRAKTHLPPLMLSVRLTNINLQQMEKILSHTDDAVYLNNLQSLAKREANIFLWRLLWLAFIGGFAGPYLFGERDRRRLIAAALSGVLILGIMLATAYATFQPLAFMNPEFEGILAAAPWMFGLIEDLLLHVKNLGAQLELVVGSINNLFTQVERFQPLGTAEGDLKVAHISDLHNNPAGMDFVRQVIETFGVHMVIDTGDITDFGTDLEAGLAAPIEAFGIPYVFVPGNHDAPNAIMRLKSIPNVHVLEEGVIEILDLCLAGIADPASGGSNMVIAAEPVLDDYAVRLQEIINEAKRSPHLIAVHHPRIARHFLQKVPLILTGHTHQFSLEQLGETVVINAGTTGAAGIRGLQTGRETPYSLVLLHFARQKEGDLSLKAADIIHVFQSKSGFSLERRFFPAAEAEDQPEPDEAENNAL